jgi:hypothetical protein
LCKGLARLFDSMAQRMLARGSTAGLLVLSQLASASAAPAQILYEAAPDCPPVETFLARVREKANGIEVVPSTRADAEVRITLRPSEEAYSGRMEIRRPSGPSVRELAGPSCEETASALAFVLALALRPNADATPDETTDVPVTLRTSSTTPAVIVERPGVIPMPPKATISWWAGVQGGLQSAPLPTWSPTVGAFVELRLAEAGRIAPSFALGVSHAGPAAITTDIESTRVSWTAGRASMCPVRVHLGGRVALVPCVGMHVGAITASGMPLIAGSTGQSSTAPWVDALGELHVDIAPMDALTLRLGVEVMATLTEYDIAYHNPNVVVFHTPAASFGAALGVAFKFW